MRRGGIIIHNSHDVTFGDFSGVMEHFEYERGAMRGFSATAETLDGYKILPVDRMMLKNKLHTCIFNILYGTGIHNFQYQ